MNDSIKKLICWLCGFNTNNNFYNIITVKIKVKKNTRHKMSEILSAVEKELKELGIFD